MAITNINTSFSLLSAALIGGFTTLAMILIAPFAELYIYPRLVIPGNAATTIVNLGRHQTLFAVLIVGYLITFIGDILASWAFYILLKPVHAGLSALAALLRITFATIAIVSLLNLVDVFRLITTPYYTTLFTKGQLTAQVMFLLNSFRYGFHFGLIFFGIYLGLLGYLVSKSKYIPLIIGLLLFITGLGYAISALQPYLFPDLKIGFVTYTYLGEVVFMFWLIIRGWKIPEVLV